MTQKKLYEKENTRMMKKWQIEIAVEIEVDANITEREVYDMITDQVWKGSQPPPNASICEHGMMVREACECGAWVLNDERGAMNHSDVCVIRKEKQFREWIDAGCRGYPQEQCASEDQLHEFFFGTKTGTA
jgi:hypothetical protein